jgi:hypothetical protein
MSVLVGVIILKGIVEMELMLADCTSLAQIGASGLTSWTRAPWKLLASCDVPFFREFLNYVITQ